MATDRLPNSTQMDALNSYLNTIAGKIGNPYSLENKLNPAYINYDSTHAAVTEAQRDQIETNKNNISLLNKYGGGKNKFAYTVDTAKALNTSSAYSWDGNACTVNGITYTFNSDGTISANGTILDTSTNAILGLANYTGVSGDVLSAEQSGRAYIYLRGGNTSTASGPYAEWSSGDIGVSRTVAIVVSNGAGTVNLVFKPMISSVTDYSASSAYQPYAMSNTELTNNILIVDITNKVSMKTGFTIDISHSILFKQGKHIFGNLVLKKTTGVYNSTGDTVATITDYPPISTVVNDIGLTNTVNQMQNIGWIYISSASESPAGSITIRDAVGTINNCAVIQIDYVTA